MTDYDFDELDITDLDIFDKIDSLDLETSLVHESTVSRKNQLINCEECGGRNFETDVSNGRVVCLDCFLVQSEILDRNINNLGDNTNSTYGCATSFYYGKSSLGTKASGSRFTTISLLDKWSQMPYKERSLLDVLQEIERRCKKHGIQAPIIENAKILFKRVNDLKVEVVESEDHKDKNAKEKNLIIRGLNRQSIKAGCVFYGAIMQHMPRTTKEIALVFDIEEKQVTRGCRKLRKILPLDDILSGLKSSQSYNFISRVEYAKSLGISQDNMKIAKNIAINIKKLGIASDHQPPSVAAGALLLLSEILKLNLDKKKISKTFKISQVTIIKTYRKIFPYRGVILSNEKTDQMLEKMKKIEENSPPMVSNPQKPKEKELPKPINREISKELIEVDSDSEQLVSVNSEDYKSDEEPVVIKKEKKKAQNLISRYK